MSLTNFQIIISEKSYPQGSLRFYRSRGCNFPIATIYVDFHINHVMALSEHTLSRALSLSVRDDTFYKMVLPHV